MAEGSGILKLGDYEIKAFKLISSTGAIVDLYTSFSELTILEDIYQSCISGFVMVTDSNDNIGAMDLHGSEFLQLTLDKPSLDEPIDQFFRVYKISNRIIKNRVSTAYVIHFTTEDHFISNQYKVSRAFRGPAEASVLSILKNDLKVNPKKVDMRNIEASYGDLNVVIPYMHPFRAIQYLSSRATNKNGSFYFFYENREGYNFKSLDAILNGRVYKTYNLSPKVLDPASPSENFNGINQIVINQNFDTLTTLTQGGFAARMKNFNVLRRQYTVNDVNLTSRAGYPTLGGGYPVNNLINRRGDSLLTSFQSFEKYSVSTTTNADYDDVPNSSETFIFRSMEHAVLHNCRMTVTIPGDPYIKVGDIISVNLPRFYQSTTAEQKLDEFYSGLMLVASLRHTVTPTAHTTYLEVVKDSVAGTLSDASNSAIVEKAKK